jgi:hypothetical protein
MAENTGLPGLNRTGETPVPLRRFKVSFDLQQWTRIKAMNWQAKVLPTCSRQGYNIAAARFLQFMEYLHDSRIAHSNHDRVGTRCGASSAGRLSAPCVRADQQVGPTRFKDRFRPFQRCVPPGVMERAAAMCSRA